MPDAALYAYHAARAAIAEARLNGELLADPRTGLIVGSGSSPSLEMADTVALARAQGARKVLPYAVPRLMGNTTSANLATAFGIQGPSYSIVSACATSSHCIGHAGELIQLGKLDRVIAGGADEVRWTTALMFDAESDKSLLPAAVALCDACVVEKKCLAYGMAHREEELKIIN